MAPMVSREEKQAKKRLPSYLEIYKEGENLPPAYWSNNEHQKKTHKREEIVIVRSFFRGWSLWTSSEIGQEWVSVTTSDSYVIRV